MYINLKTKIEKNVNLGTVSFIWVTGHVNDIGRKDEAEAPRPRGITE
jgi:hypothetical protein